MDGAKLLTAAKIIVKAGEQIEAIISILKEKLGEALTNENIEIDVDYDTDEEYSEGDWIYKSYLWDIALFKIKRGKKTKQPFAHIAIKVVLYDEDECKDSKWEPSLYISYGTGEIAFDLESSLWLSPKKKGWDLDGNKLWNWKEEDEQGWGFVLPLVKLNFEETLVEQIIKPVKKLFDGTASADAFPSDNDGLAFRFTQDVNGTKIIS
ncbi:MAG: hypothetical protein NT140_05680 [Deltaproteobacteria bacterium]|nr:hypothetical protein [Deltaproteobacteria bacterium]